MVSESYDFRICLSYSHLFKIKFFLIDIHKWKLPNSTHFEHGLMELVAFTEVAYSGGYDDFCFLWSEVYFELLFASRSQMGYKRAKIISNEWCNLPFCGSILKHCFSLSSCSISIVTMALDGFVSVKDFICVYLTAQYSKSIPGCGILSIILEMLKVLILF